ncbi:hypothetical protein [Paraburkholderia sp. SIMBA_054]|uniref:hypothetical protein n=1 Tax=Paraburkholderia sp. SIMBA_054 TaxID=3085795 RepID=UPI00397C8217
MKAKTAADSLPTIRQLNLIVLALCALCATVGGLVGFAVARGLMGAHLMPARATPGLVLAGAVIGLVFGICWSIELAKTLDRKRVRALARGA